jgi:hypothetical protein
MVLLRKQVFIIADSFVSIILCKSVTPVNDVYNTLRLSGRDTHSVCHLEQNTENEIIL